MPELIAEEPKNWLQIYVDAVTEKDPYKRLALVQRLRQIPRHDESDEAPERPRLQVAPKPAVPKPPAPPRTVVAPSDALPARPHVMRRRKAAVSSKSRRGPRSRRG